MKPWSTAHLKHQEDEFHSVGGAYFDLPPSHFLRHSARLRA
eukprot:CAMPEP_0118971498 /NCGR_PEP_ID=MMETSP1173-20130426/8108_1 /TAXON_ID=1034831 /ORGANISM="Rhizochromulina marina cf, Strain CCMP1243" /LENGTH=40 /DNA_ID= /DNA_START= /DNA_END= /DNA_ORIENTATION=